MDSIPTASTILSSVFPITWVSSYSACFVAQRGAAAAGFGADLGSVGSDVRSVHEHDETVSAVFTGGCTADSSGTEVVVISGVGDQISAPLSEFGIRTRDEA